MTITKKLKKGAFLTDIHFGKKSNSPAHNQDCLNYIDWFVEQAHEHGCDYIGFLGDWNENRSALNIATLQSSYHGAKKLNDAGLPVFFCVGNHDLYHRHTREVYSVIPFNEFENFTVVNDPMIIDRIGNGVLFSPFLFHEEYPNTKKYLKVDAWFGHFEFKGFLLTGHNTVMMSGPEPAEFEGPKHIVSGHFHKRQQRGNIIYMGNTFPMDFGDTGDNDRGMMIYDHITATPTFINWGECPKYIRANLSDIMDGSTVISPNSRVKCIIDVPVKYEESISLRKECLEKYNLREFVMEESKSLVAAITGTETNVEGEDVHLDTVDDLVIQMLRDIKSEQISNELLIKQYRSLTIG